MPPGPSPAPDGTPVDLLVTGADLVVTMDDDRREIAGGWVACSGGLVTAVGGPSDTPPAATRVLRADGCLVTPGLVNTHHHIYQNLTRAYLPATSSTLFDWLTTLYPRWALLDEEASYVSAWVGLAELAVGGCTTSHRPPLRPPGGGWRPAVGRDRGRPRPRRALPPDPGVDVAVAEGRWAAARLGGPGRRRHPRRQRGGRRPAPRPRARRDGAGGAGPVLAVLGDARPHAADRRAGRAPRRPPAHAPGRGSRRGHVLPRDVRPPADRALRGLRLGLGPIVGRPLHLPGREGDRPHGRLGHGRGPLPELEHDDRRRRHRPGRRLPRRRGAGRPGVRRIGLHRLRVAVARGPGRPAARTPAGRADVVHRPGRPRAGRPAARPPASGGSASWGSWRRARRPTWWRGSWTASPSRGRSPTPSRRCSAAARPRRSTP